VWLEDESKGGRGNVAFRLEVWFACRDDKTCDAICTELYESLREATGGKNSVINAGFKKLQHFLKKHSVRGREGLFSFVFCARARRARLPPSHPHPCPHATSLPTLHTPV
jgi:hypothetical protein